MAGAFVGLVLMYLAFQIWVRKRSFGQAVRRIDIKSAFADPRAKQAADVEMAKKPRAPARPSDGLASRLRDSLRFAKSAGVDKSRISRPTLVLPPIHEAAVPRTPPRSYRVGSPYDSDDLDSLYSRSSKA
jgi:hypothetical protein